MARPLRGEGGTLYRPDLELGKKIRKNVATKLEGGGGGGGGLGL